MGTFQDLLTEITLTSSPYGPYSYILNVAHGCLAMTHGSATGVTGKKLYLLC